VKLVLRRSELTEVDATMQVLGELPNLAILRLKTKPFGLGGRVSLPVRDPPETGKISRSRNYPGLETARISRKISPKFKFFKKICMNGNRCIPSGNRRFPTGFR